MINFSRLREIAHDGLHGALFSVVAWLWSERRNLKAVLEDGLERRHTHMTPSEIIAALQLAPELLPALVQVLTDANKVLADFTALMSKLQSAKLAAPAAATPPPTPPPAAA